MNCPHCGESIPDGIKFCPCCGMGIESPPSPDDTAENQSQATIVIEIDESQTGEIPVELETEVSPPSELDQTPPVSKIANRYGVLALVFQLLGVLILIIGIFLNISEIAGFAKRMVKDGDTVPAVFCLLVPLSLVISIIIDVVLTEKSVIKRKKLWKIKILTPVLSFVYLAYVYIVINIVLASYYTFASYIAESTGMVSNDMLILKILGGVYYGALPLAGDALYQNYLLFAAICFTVSIMFYIIKKHEITKLNKVKEPQSGQIAP